MYECLNVVAEAEGVPGCVLIRGVKPLTGLHRMRESRGWTGKDAGLANGPGKLTKAESFRIGCIGALARGDFERLVAAAAAVLEPA